ncbi:hypothetical protein KIN20_015775 [Parelaphostrongylus tenuis]|uniref:Uncharacterized protein n=1 Tax=Parelaphostrongylus tenuis TaxID=148309 RepID=A0AAD5QP99_PARTN|nr:hypothetical protein KIN20_015775 [Parelaphostrongylus tenuis]
MVPSRSTASPSPQATVTPLEKHYHELEFRMQVGYWRVHSAKTVFGDKMAMLISKRDGFPLSSFAGFHRF